MTFALFICVSQTGAEARNLRAGLFCGDVLPGLHNRECGALVKRWSWFKSTSRL